MKKGIIYKITNLVNGKIYIGQTIRKLNRRISDYKSSIKTFKDKQKTKNCRIYLALSKYKIDNFNFEIIDYADNENTLNEKEIYWIKFYDSTNKEKGYNLTSGGKKNFSYTKQTLKLIGDASSKRNKGKGNPMYGKKSSTEKLEKIYNAQVESGWIKPIYCYRINGAFVDKFRSKHHCNRVLGVDRKSLNEVLKGKYKQANGYKFYYDEQ